MTRKTVSDTHVSSDEMRVPWGSGRHGNGKEESDFGSIPFRCERIKQQTQSERWRKGILNVPVVH
jgi:hypothetical protein